MINRLLKLSIALLYTLSLIFKKRETLIVLCYHEVTTKQKQCFINQLEMLKNRTQPVFADAPFLEATALQRVAVTFDDGFANLLENAFPVMKERNIPVTIFVPNACLGKNPPWLEYSTHENKTEKLMSEQQLKAISKQVLIGSHGFSHVDLTDEKINVENELIQSKQHLETLLDKEVTLLAFPYGRSNETARTIAKNLGFKRVFNADPISKENDFFMGRVDVSPDDWKIEFYLKILGAYAWLPKAIFLKKSLRKS
jgi:peptidoglycan/xylan/chitin deacetylase (PgdA/CDA1 family)